MTLRLSGGRRLRSPEGDSARPTPSRVRQAVMNMLAPELAGCRWLDLCSGSGAMACEALQRGAAAVVAVERDRRHAAVARTNLEAVASGLGRSSQVAVYCCPVERWLQRPVDQPFDLIYADPPYAAGLYGGIAAAVAGGPWLKPAGTLLLECGSSQLPATPAGWTLAQSRRYGSTTVLILQQGSG